MIWRQLSGSGECSCTIEHNSIREVQKGHKHRNAVVCSGQFSRLFLSDANLTMLTTPKNQKREQLGFDCAKYFLLSWWLVYPGHLLFLIEKPSINLHRDPIHFFWSVSLFLLSVVWTGVFLRLMIKKRRIARCQYLKFLLILINQILALFPAILPP